MNRKLSFRLLFSVFFILILVASALRLGSSPPVHAADASFTELWASGDIGYVSTTLVNDVDNDTTNEIVVGTGETGYSSNVYSGCIYVFNAVTHSLEWQSGDIGSVAAIVMNDATNEIIVCAETGHASNVYHGYIYVFDAVTHSLKWQSSDLGLVRNVVLTDLNGDGQKEIVALAWHNSTTLLGDEYGYVHVFNGTTHQQLWQSPNVGAAGHLAVDDLDGDGIKEIIAGGIYYYTCTIHGHMYVFDGATFAQKWVSGDINEITAITVGDVDSDGVKEIVFGQLVTDCGAGWVYPGYIHIVDGVTFNEEWVSQNIGTPGPFTLTDVDDDGRTELVVGVARTGGNTADLDRGYIYVFDGQTHVQEWQSPNVNDAIIKVDDIDNDGTKEIVARTGMEHSELTGIDVGHVYIFNGKTFAEEWMSNDIIGGWNLAITDIDKDGTKEILTTARNAIGYCGHLCIFDAITHSEEWQSPEIGLGGLMVADLDGDGWQEIVAGGSTQAYHGNLHVYSQSVVVPKVTALALPFAWVDTAFPVLVIVKNQADSTIDDPQICIDAPGCILELPEDECVEPWWGIRPNGYSFAIWFVSVPQEGDLTIEVCVVGEIAGGIVSGCDTVEVEIFD